MKLWIYGALAGTLALAACASAPSLSADQCTAMDWRALGQKDGQTGQALTALNDEISLCKPYGITPDTAAYNAGRAEGLKLYCAPTTLLDATIQGVGDPFSCDPMTTAQRTSFDTGKTTRAAVQRYQAIKQQYDQLVQQKQNINAEGQRLTQQYNQTTDETVRQQIVQRLNQLREALKATDAKLAEANPVMQKEETDYKAAVSKYEAYKSSLSR